MRINILVIILLLLSPGMAVAQEFEKNIMTGGAKGTYIQIGRNLAEIGRRCGQTLNVIESAGSLENLVAVRRRSNTQFGIVQSDVLDYLKTFATNDPELQAAIWGVRIMFPLYNEEVHILAKREIATLDDLEGRKVAIGVKDSGTYLTASLILDIMRLEDVDRQDIGSAEALPLLMNDEIDALFYVAGAPASLFSDPDIDGSKFHLLPLTEAPLLATYTPSIIESGTYPFHTEPLDVIAVKAVLMSFEYQPRKNRYQRESCKAVSDFSHLLLTNLEWLKEEGHPKWQDVDLAALPPGWEVGSCVKQGMAVDYEVECDDPLPVVGTPASNIDEEYLNLLKERLKP
jgi:uncharacterized protein